MNSSTSPHRKSVPLSEQDLHDLAVLRGSDACRAALSALVSSPVPATSSEAFFLHAIWQAGLRAVANRVEEDGYAALAQDPDYQAHAAESRAAARRRHSESAENA